MTSLRGTMLVPGVSGNGRLYTPELISKAHDRLVERLASDEALPVTMMTHHAAGDDSKEIVGHITSVTLKGDQLDYTAELADTVPAKTIENLVKPGPNGKPFLKSTSIRGWWLGPVETTTYEGRQVTTADDLEIDGLDFTKNPGVKGASVEIAPDTSTAETAAGRTLITETVEARIEFSETQEAAVPAKPSFGDPGYLPDKVKRYPTSDRAAAETSWARIQLAENAAAYTPNQLKRVKGRIKESLRTHGADMTETAATGADIAEHDVRLSEVTECYDCWDAPGTAGFSISAHNGPLTVSVTAYSGIEPKDLAGVAQAAMKAAVDAVHALDPDDDGDVDTGTTETPAGTGGTESDPKEATVAETKAPEAATPSSETEPAGDKPITQADLNAAVETAVTAALAAAVKPAGDTTETIPAGPATATEAVAKPIDEAALRASITADLISEMRANGTLGRKGLVASRATENGEPAKPLHEMNDEEFAAYRNSTLEAVVPLDL